VQGGDGFYNRIDPVDPNIIYAESQDGSLSRRDLKTSESKSIRPQEENDQAPRYRFQWNSPLMISAHDHNTIYYGGNHLFKSTDRGDTWTVLGEDLTTNAERDEMSILGRKIDKQQRRALARRRCGRMALHHQHRRIAGEGRRAVGGHRRRQRADVARRRQDLDQRGFAHHGLPKMRLREPHRAVAHRGRHGLRDVRQSPQRRLCDLHLQDHELRRFLHSS
jgi:hypothetical protein